MSDITIYHNPRCSKSRQTLDLLKEEGLDPVVIDYQKTPPAAEELDRICTMLDKGPLEVTRTQEKLFKELGLSKQDERSRAEWLRLLTENPKLIERPIVVNGDRAAIGRPPENVRAIL
ncbi:arsenate reductase (glutaredoxin) [Thiohalorhabdus methylotrophus]|uniref:Arsenate reductase n=1 Tax=Thiohalorhabdus methylotrophus TaxID=3242694 RepID=A0ABV4TWV4_9GAMM